MLYLLLYETYFIVACIKIESPEYIFIVIIVYTVFLVFTTKKYKYKKETGRTISLPVLFITF
ncbi:hypothetical protein DWQ65_09545 [Treponema phagedenis]|uniref:Uncharacterized protein n=1 Tax=Treponema phagedenis TaxID=162 RepID=A0A0B7GXF7_TREPH|nr:hypothetical protein HMPREF9554_00106 [Treponema phagedenis F0421]QSH96069.1 hypothetical protein C5O78_13790 [Treponema phagedenis]QSI00297.1 hypothetical protein DWQ65_09545 [Treponema phagedenis]CEM63359.1 conserved hypothetical protein [Treponema phagedenis]